MQEAKRLPRPRESYVGKTAEAARGRSNSAGGDSREEETTGDDSAREGRAVIPASEREGRPEAVTERGENAFKKCVLEDATFSTSCPYPGAVIPNAADNIRGVSILIAYVLNTKIIYDQRELYRSRYMSP